MKGRFAAVVTVCMTVGSHAIDEVRADGPGVSGECACGSLAVTLAAAADDCEASSIKLLTASENPSLDETTAVIVLSGPITSSMDEDVLRLRESVSRFDTIILDLDSPGGRLDHAVELIDALQSLRSDARLRTYVRQGSKCLSACVLVFQQGDERIAGGASSWLFHGACPPFSDLPLAKETDRFVGLMVAAGASEKFFEFLVERGYLTSPGEFWLSGFELFSVHKANIITELLDPWRPIRAAIPAPP